MTHISVSSVHIFTLADPGFPRERQAQGVGNLLFGIHFTKKTA